MAEQSSFFNSVNGDRKYDMEQFAAYFKQFLSNGIFHGNHEPSLQVSYGEGVQVKIDIGSAYIEGFMYQNTAPFLLSHEASDLTNSRIDRIVLRLDRGVNARNIKAYVKKGLPASNPQPPSLQRDEVIFEISLAQVRIDAGKTEISSVTDERLNPLVAGLVNSLITVPTDQFLEQWQDWMGAMNNEKDSYQELWQAWFSGIQNQIGTRLLSSNTEPADVVAGDVWLKSL